MLREGISNKDAEENRDTDHAKHKYLGQTYPYHKNIMGPEYLGMTTEGSIDALGKNIVGLINYGQTLITGDGHANAKVNREKTDEPLGDKFFMKTMGTCYPVLVTGQEKQIQSAFYKDGEMTGKQPSIEWDCDKRKGDLPEGEKCDFVYANEKGEQLNKLGDRKSESRYIYIDNIPTGRIPGLGQLTGMRGLIPGMIENLGAFNPSGILNAITAPSVPPCIQINMKTIKFDSKDDNSENWKHIRTFDEHYVALSDIEELNPCSFEPGGGNSRVNPISGAKKDDCPTITENFANLFSKKHEKKLVLKINDKPIAKIFHMSFGVLLAYLLWKVLRKETPIY